MNVDGLLGIATLAVVCVNYLLVLGVTFLAPASRPHPVLRVADRRFAGV